MRIVSCLVAFATLSFLLSLPAVGADEKDKKADAPKKEADKPAVKKDEPAKKDDAAKKDGDKKEPEKKMAMPKMPHTGKFKGLENDPAKAAEKMMRSTLVQATVMAIVAEKKSLRLQLTIPYVKVNAGEVQNYQNAYMNMLRATNAQGVLNAQQSMAQHQARIYELATTTKEVEWQATDDVKVRMRNPPAQFDEKGRVKRYTAKELRELKGDSKLPGFPAEFSDLKTGQIVQVTMVQKKDAARPRRGKDAEVLAENMPHMSLIYILAEPRNP